MDHQLIGYHFQKEMLLQEMMKINKSWYQSYVENDKNDRSIIDKKSYICQQPQCCFFLLQIIAASTSITKPYGHQTQILTKEKSVIRRRKSHLKKYPTNLFHRGMELPLLQTVHEHSEEIQVSYEERDQPLEYTTRGKESRSYSLPTERKIQISSGRVSL